MIDLDLSVQILNGLSTTGEEFARFQQVSGLHCPKGCGKCCENPDVHCSPYELLPLAFELLKNGQAEAFLNKAKENIGKSCILLSENKCSYYQYRPYVCRSFGVAGRHYKQSVEFSICKVLKDEFKVNSINEQIINEYEIPFIETSRKKLEAIDPSLLEKQKPINIALGEILEKVLLWNSYSSSSL